MHQHHLSVVSEPVTDLGLSKMLGFRLGKPSAVLSLHLRTTSGHKDCKPYTQPPLAVSGFTSEPRKGSLLITSVAWSPSSAASKPSTVFEIVWAKTPCSPCPTRPQPVPWVGQWRSLGGRAGSRSSEAAQVGETVVGSPSWVPLTNTACFPSTSPPWVGSPGLVY